MISELRVEIPEEVVEGESSVLFCKTTCNLSDKRNFTWYKNGKRLSESIVSNQLLLRSVSSEDTGNYSCAVRDQKHLSSPALTLSVRCTSRIYLHISTIQSRLIKRCTVRRNVYIFQILPKSVSVSINGSGEILEEIQWLWAAAVTQTSCSDLQLV